jgi:putative nucleotidyltransferase with HDIG domain
MSDAVVATAEPLTPSDIARFWPLNGLSPEHLSVVSQHTEVSRHRAGDLVLSAGSDDTFAWYLVSGAVGLCNGEPTGSVVDSGSDLGRFPLSNLRPHRCSITALSEVTLFRVDKTVLRRIMTRDDSPLHQIAISLPARQLTADPLCAGVFEDLERGQVPIPSLPNIVLQIYRVINDEDADARKIARVIQADPAITAKLIATANSTFYRRARGIGSCTDAVVRLGPSAVRNLVTAFVMRGLFQSRVPVIQHHVKHLWAHSAMVAAISFNLARATPGMNADTALLAGLLHDIGSLCVLGYAERHPEIYTSTEQLATTIATFRGQLGAEILRRWDLPQAIVNAARDAEDWQRDPKPEADYSDLVLISQLHLIADEERLWSMPRLYEVPAFRKMASGRLGPNLSLMVLDEAKQYIDETAGWLTH